jgi:hypothetical protein
MKTSNDAPNELSILLIRSTPRNRKPNACPPIPKQNALEQLTKRKHQPQALRLIHTSMIYSSTHCHASHAFTTPTSSLIKQAEAGHKHHATSENLLYPSSTHQLAMPTLEPRRKGESKLQANRCGAGKKQESISRLLDPIMHPEGPRKKFLLNPQCSPLLQPRDGSNRRP